MSDQTKDASLHSDELNDSELEKVSGGLSSLNGPGGDSGGGGLNAGGNPVGPASPAAPLPSKPAPLPDLPWFGFKPK